MTPSLRPQTCERPPCVQSQVPSRSDGAQGLLEERRAFSPDRDRDRDRDPDRDRDRDRPRPRPPPRPRRLPHLSARSLSTPPCAPNHPTPLKYRGSVTSTTASPAKCASSARSERNATGDVGVDGLASRRTGSRLERNR